MEFSLKQPQPHYIQGHPSQKEIEFYNHFYLDKEHLEGMFLNFQVTKVI